MPVDPNIALGVQPIQIPNPLAQYAQVMGIQNATNQNALAQYSLAKAQRDEEATNALGKIYQQVGTDPDKVMAAAAQNPATARLIPDLQSKLLKASVDKATIAEKMSQVDKGTADLMKQGFETLGPRFKAIYDQPSKAGAVDQLVQQISQYQSQPKLQQAAINALQDVSKLPDDPAQIKSWALGHWTNTENGRKAWEDMYAAKHMGSTGGMTNIPLNAMGQQMGPGMPATMTPGETATNSIARANLGLKAIEVDPFGMSGARDIAARAGAPVAPIGGVSGPGAASGATPPANAPAGAPSAIQGLHGDDLLKALPPQVADMVKGYAEGRIAFPGGFAMKSPQVLQMMNLVTQYDPNFDAVNYQARSKTRNSFVAGPDSDNIKALNTVADHLVALKSAYDTLGNTRAPILNTIVNAAGNAGLSTDIQKNTAAVSTKAEAVAHELAKVFRQTGMSEGEINAWKQKVSTSAAPASSNETINSALDLIQGRLNALGAKYNQGMGTTKDPLQLLSPHAQQALQQLRGSLGGNSPTASGIKFLGFE